MTSGTETITISRVEYEACLRKLEANATYIAELEKKLNWLMEQFRLNQARRFGASSEKSSHEAMETIGFLFNEAEVQADQSTSDQGEKGKEHVVREHTRKVRSGSLRDIVPDNIAVEEVRHELSEAERQCPKCGETMEPIGTEVVETLELIPARAVIHRDVYVHYACQNCKKNDIEVPIVETPKDTYLLPGGFASAEAVAFIMVQKFVMYVPLYRQELEWNRQGLKLSRQTMSDWFLRGAEMLTAVYDELHRQIVLAEILHADETTLQVLHEAEKSAQSKSYMWLYRTGREEKRQIVLYEYQTGRGACHPKAFLSGFHGYLQTDGYSGYNDVTSVTHVGCWAHLRRKFDEAVKALPAGKKAGAASSGLAYCTKLFMLEREFQDLTPEERFEKRMEKAKPLLDQFLAWAEAREVAPKSKLGQAFTYMKNQWESLTNYLKDGRLEISNNRAEQSIKPFVMGRKNFLFANTPRGARASAVTYSIIETAKANGLDPYCYLRFLLKRLPGIGRTAKDWIEPLLPWNAPKECSVKS